MGSRRWAKEAEKYSPILWLFSVYKSLRYIAKFSYHREQLPLTVYYHAFRHYKKI
jgi:hypothetical protein